MKSHIIRSKEIETVKASWGTIQWLVSGAGKTSEHMTFGRVTIKPGQRNPLHSHPNCDEILFVAKGKVEHTLPEGGSVVLNEGDTIVINQGGTHQAINIGKEDAVVIVAFNSPDRKTESKEKEA